MLRHLIRLEDLALPSKELLQVGYTAQGSAPTIKVTGLTCVAVLLGGQKEVLILGEELVEACSASEDPLQTGGRHLHEAYGIKERWQAYLGRRLLGSPAAARVSRRLLSFLPSDTSLYYSKVYKYNSVIVKLIVQYCVSRRMYVRRVDSLWVHPGQSRFV